MNESSSPAMNQTLKGRPWRPSGKAIPSEQFQAWQDARQLLDKAKVELETTRQAAYREGYEKGEAEGRQAILRVLIDTQSRAGHYLEQMDREVAALVIALVERVIGRTPRADRTISAARQALSRLRKHKQVRVQVAPVEVDRFRKELADLPSPMGLSNWFTIEADPHLAIDECVIATEVGYIRAGVEAQLETLRQTVFDSLQSRSEEG